MEGRYFSNTILCGYNYTTQSFQYTKEYYEKKIVEDPTNKLKYQNKIRQLKPLENIYQHIGRANFTSYIKCTKKIEDFKLKASIYTTYPITAKIGTRKGEKARRVGYYEIHMDIHGNQKKKKTGYARIKSS